MKKKWITNLTAVLKALGISREQVAAGNLTAEEWKQVNAKYTETFGSTLAEDKEKGEDEPEEPATEAVAVSLSDEERAVLAEALGVPAETVATEAHAAAKQAAQAAAAAKQLAQEPEVKKPVEVATAKRANLFGGAHTAEHLYGIEHPLYARNKQYNQLTAGTPMATLNVSGRDTKAVQDDFLVLSELLAKRMAEHTNAGTFGQLSLEAISAGKIDAQLPTGELGEYIVRRTDAILAYFKTVPTVRGSIFPVHSNVQNKEAAVGVIIGELTQGYRKGRIFKGGMQFSPDTYKVDDLMFKFNFEDLIELEKEYIGWLNRNEGSAIIKWTFIEWVMVHYGEQLIKEQSIRNVIGVRVPQQNVVANPSNLSADGALRAITRAVDQYRVLPFAEIGTYDAYTMLDTVEAFADKVVEVSDNGLEGKKIYLNKRHQRWYIRAYREKYGKDADFTGASATLVDLDPAAIVWVPNMRENDYLIFCTEPGNVELLEAKPGEMTAFEYTPEFEGVAVKSRWKEGAHVVKAGAPFKSAAALEADNFAHQFLYVNKPATSLTLAASIDLSGNTYYVISCTTAVTSVKGVSADRVIRLEAGAAGVKVGKSGAFAGISADFVAGAKGDYIELYPEYENATETVEGETVTYSKPTGKLLELGRKVTTAAAAE